MHLIACSSESFTTSFHTDHFAGGSLLAAGRQAVAGHQPRVDHRQETYVAQAGHHTLALRGTRDRTRGLGQTQIRNDIRQGTHQSHLEVGRLVANNRLHAGGMVVSNRLQVERLVMERLAMDNRLQV